MAEQKQWTNECECQTGVPTDITFCPMHAAAPYLLAACREADNFIAARHCAVSTGEADTTDTASVLSKIATAIAKATASPIAEAEVAG